MSSTAPMMPGLITPPAGLALVEIPLLLVGDGLAHEERDEKHREHRVPHAERRQAVTRRAITTSRVASAPSVSPAIAKIQT
ncbi:hypothetical protein [Microbacterium lacticum]